MDKMKTIITGYHDGILSEREALYQLVDLPPPNHEIKMVLFNWLDGKLQGKVTLRQVSRLVNGPTRKPKVPS